MAEAPRTHVYVAGRIDPELTVDLARAIMDDEAALGDDIVLTDRTTDVDQAAQLLTDQVEADQDQGEPLEIHRDNGWLSSTEEMLQSAGIGYVRWAFDGETDPELTGYDPDTEAMVTHAANMSGEPVIARGALTEALENDQLNDAMARMQRVDPECIGPAALDDLTNGPGSP